MYNSSQVVASWCSFVGRIAKVEKFARPSASGVSEKQQQSFNPPVLRSSVLRSCLWLQPKAYGGPPTPQTFEGQLQSPSFFPSFLPCYFSTPIFFDFQPNMTPSWTPCWPSSTPDLPFFFRSPFQLDFRPHFGPISDPKSTSKSIQNQSNISSKIKLQTSPISASSSIKF